MTVDELISEIKRLPQADQEALYNRLGVVDQSEMFGAEIRVDDWQGKDATNPRVTITHTDGSTNTIDIMASIEANALSLGHPAILQAIHRWEQIVRLEYAQARSPIYQPKPPEFAKIALRHLERVGEVLVRGVKKRRIDTKEAPDLYTQKLGLDIDYIYLRRAWEFLKEPKIKKIRRPEERAKQLEKKLREFFLHPSPILRLSLSVAHRHSLNTLLSRVVLDRFFNWAVFQEPERVFGEDYLQGLNPPIVANYNPGTVGKKHGDGSFEVYAYEKTISLKVSEAIRQLGLFREGTRKLLIVALGITGLAKDVTGAEFFNKDKQDVIIEFLKSEIGQQSIKQSPSWPVMQSRFDSWRFPNDEPRTLSTYRAKAKKLLAKRKSYNSVFLPEWFSQFSEYSDFLGDFSLIENAVPDVFWGLGSKYLDVDGRFLLPAWLNEYRFFENGSKWASLPVVSIVTT